MRAVSEGRVVSVQGHGFFFVEFSIISDLACLKACMGIGSGKGSKKHPCPWCMADYQQLGDFDTKWDARPETLDNSILGKVGIPKERLKACSMHCHHRVTERLLRHIMQHVDNKEPSVMRALKATLTS